MNKQESGTTRQGLSIKPYGLDIPLDKKLWSVFLMICGMISLGAVDMTAQCTQTISDFSTQHSENLENGTNALWSPITTSTVCTGTWAIRSGRTPSNRNGNNWSTGPRRR